MCLLLTAARVWEEKEGGGQESKSWQTAGVGHAVLCFWEAPVLQHQRPGGHHQTACGKTRGQHEHFSWNTFLILNDVKQYCWPMLSADISCENCWLYAVNIAWANTEREHFVCLFSYIYFFSLPRFTWRKSCVILASTTWREHTRIRGSSGQNTDITKARKNLQSSFWHFQHTWFSSDAWSLPDQAFARNWSLGVRKHWIMKSRKNRVLQGEVVSCNFVGNQKGLQETNWGFIVKCSRSLPDVVSVTAPAHPWRKTHLSLS